MSGGVGFSPVKFLTLAQHIAQQRRNPTGEEIAWLMFNIDMEGYRRHGQAITGATYLRGRRHPEVREIGEGWFQRFARAQIPRWARACGWALTAYGLVRWKPKH